ncbi:MAG TPA: GNAT family N-acetyltransferase [Candidatus Dormibacteraeota bacterium]|nr:GNAT family N-acetyltransferase [Candidatus Dormibacteraeota bacterium]
MKQRPRGLDAIFAPRTVAVIGATERPGSIGRAVLRNLVGHPFGGTVFPVTPAHESVMGIKAYPSIGAVPEPVDLAVVVTPAPSVPELIGACADAGVRGAIVISAGFREVGAAGAELERRILHEAARGEIRIVGPNCLGVMRPWNEFNATFAGASPQPGSVAFISQSGALCSAILDWSIEQHVGFSAFVSIGSMLDVGWGDLITYFGEDPRTHAIVLAMESMGDVRAFVSAAREVARAKPIIVLKAGRTEEAARAAASHIGALVGKDDAVDAAFRRCGLLRVESIADLFNMADVLAKQPRPHGKRLAIVTNAGGPGVLATDALVTGGGTLAHLSEATRSALDEALPEPWSHGNPVDVLGDADAARYGKALEIVAQDDDVDGILVVMTPQGLAEATPIAERLASFARTAAKPILASWMGGLEVAEGASILKRAAIPTFAYADTAARMFNYQWRYEENLRALYETPLPPDDRIQSTSAAGDAKAILARARAAGHTLLSEGESKRLLACYGIPTVETRVAATAEEAARLAEELGYPVVLKLQSHTIAHKRSAGGVRLGLRDADEVRAAFARIESRVAAPDFDGVSVQPMVTDEGYELFVAATLDAQIGPVLAFGHGGRLVEAIGDRALGLPPLNTTLAHRLMERTRIFEALSGARGEPAIDVEALEHLLVRFSYLVADQRWIRSIEINPLLAAPGTLLALDARVELHPPQTTAEEIPPLAIRPYPVQYVDTWRMSGGETLTVRPVRPEDEPMMRTFHDTVSEQSVYFRYAHVLSLRERVGHERLSRVCFIDYDREMALVAVREGPTPAIVGVGRLVRMHGGRSAEFAVLVSDEYQHRGIGTELLRRLVELAPKEGIGRVVGYILRENGGMQEVARRLGFTLRYSEEYGMMEAEIFTGARSAAQDARGG